MGLRHHEVGLRAASGKPCLAMGNLEVIWLQMDRDFVVHNLFKPTLNGVKKYLVALIRLVDPIPLKKLGMLRDVWMLDYWNLQRPFSPWRNKNVSFVFPWPLHCKSSTMYVWAKWLMKCTCGNSLVRYWSNFINANVIFLTKVLLRSLPPQWIKISFWLQAKSSYLLQ